MSDIQRYVNVTINRTTLAPSVGAFSDILIAADFADSDATPVFTERVREYANLAAVAAEFTTSHPVYYTAASIFAQKVVVDKVLVGRVTTTTPETWTEGLNAIKAENNKWYGLVSPERALADQEEISDWAEVEKKLYVASTDDSNLPDSTGDLAEYAQTNNYDYTSVWYHPDADGTATDPFMDGALVGLMFPKDPGSSQWAHKQLAGVASYDLTETQINTILGKNGNYYTKTAGIDITFKGLVGSGDYTDTIRGSDWLKTRIQELVFGLFVNTEKVPYTNQGAASVVNKVEEALNEGVAVGFLAATKKDDDGNDIPGWSVSVPEVSTIADAEKVARNLPDVTFIAKLAGAIVSTEIVGTLEL